VLFILALVYTFSGFTVSLLRQVRLRLASRPAEQ